MGTKALEAFDEAKRLAGVVGKMRLASAAGVTSSEAALVEDSDELMARMERSLASIRESFQSPRSTGLEGKIERASEAQAVVKLRAYIGNYLDLFARRTHMRGTVDEMLRSVTKASSNAMDVERVSIWKLEQDPERIVCLSSYERTRHRHSSGTELLAQDFPPYFDAIRSQRTIAAHDAHTDPRLCDFSEPYLTPLNIQSVLDVPIWVNDKMFGVVCYEQVGSKRTWNEDEETLGHLMAGLVATSIELKGSP